MVSLTLQITWYFDYSMKHVLNDIHSQLNQTEVLKVARPRSLSEIQKIVNEAKEKKIPVSVAGGRHAMGGQQFASNSVHIDITGLDRVLDTDPVKGLLHIEAGADWPKIIEASHAMQTETGKTWGIRQKQTGVDSVTLSGSISANAHGRGLLMQPLGDDIENLTLVNAEGKVMFCNREENEELFSLVIGGYGLFGLIYSATLRLEPRQRLIRVVDVIDLDDAMNAVYRRVEEGCLYGDFQFVIDPGNKSFLRRGVFACYKPDETEEGEPDSTSDLNPETWLKLLQLAHDNKKEAFRLYAGHYLNTDGNHYWSDTMQLSTYVPSYSDFLESADKEDPSKSTKETLVIGEHYVPKEQLLIFMQKARSILRSFGTEVIYGTIRAILRDQVSYLPWAKDDYVCIIFNLRTIHTQSGLERTANTFRALIDAGRESAGSFFLTYHRYATVEQVEDCYPKFRDWLSMKKLYDPDEIFTSSWYVHYRDAFSEKDSPVR